MFILQWFYYWLYAWFEQSQSNVYLKFYTQFFVHKINPSNSKREKADVFFRNDQFKYNLSRYNC